MWLTAPEAGQKNDGVIASSLPEIKKFPIRKDYLLKH